LVGNTSGARRRNWASVWEPNMRAIRRQRTQLNRTSLFLELSHLNAGEVQSFMVFTVIRRYTPSFVRHPWDHTYTHSRKDYVEGGVVRWKRQCCFTRGRRKCSHGKNRSILRQPCLLHLLLGGASVGSHKATLEEG